MVKSLSLALGENLALLSPLEAPSVASALSSHTCPIRVELSVGGGLVQVPTDVFLCSSFRDPFLCPLAALGSLDSQLSLLCPGSQPGTLPTAAA